MKSETLRQIFQNITPERHRKSTEAAREMTRNARAESDAMIRRMDSVVPLFPAEMDYPSAQYFNAMPCAPLGEP